MRKRRPRWIALVLSLLFFVALILLILLIPPTFQLTVFTLRFSILTIFFALLFFFCFFTGTFFFRSKVKGILIGLFIVSFLLFRLSNLTHPFFFILLASLFLTLVLLFTYRN